MPVFRGEIMFNAKKDQRYFRLEKDEQIPKPNSCRKVLMIYEFLCPCHGRMVYTDIGEP